MTSTEDIAQTLGWTITHLHAVASALDKTLESAGLRVHRYSGQMCLRPRDPSIAGVIETIDKRRAGRETMTTVEARLLRAALLGQLGDSPTATERPALGHLINLRVIRPGRRGEPFHVLTDEARQAFAL